MQMWDMVGPVSFTGATILVLPAPSMAVKSPLSIASPDLRWLTKFLIFGIHLGSKPRRGQGVSVAWMRTLTPFQQVD
jgi:hypothetical protein